MEIGKVEFNANPKSASESLIPEGWKHSVPPRRWHKSETEVGMTEAEMDEETRRYGTNPTIDTYGFHPSIEKVF